MEKLDARVGALAARQFGVVTRRQARTLGASDAAIGRRLATGRWEVLRPGVFRIAGAPASEHQAVLAATLWAGPTSAASHHSAARLLRLPGVPPTDALHVTVPRHRGPAAAGVTVHRTLELGGVDRRTVDGVPCTSPARTIVDLAGEVDAETLHALVEHARHVGLTTVAQLRNRLDRLGSRGRRGARRLRTLLETYAPRDRALESRLEVRTWRLLARSRLPVPERQHWVTANGRRVRLDFAWPPARLAVECDGWYVHGNRLVWKRDRARLACLAAARWRVLPVTWEDVTRREDETVALIAQAL